VHFPALVVEKDGAWQATFKDWPGFQVRSQSAAELPSRAQQALETRLTAALRTRKTPPHPSRRIHLWKRERLLKVPVSPDVAVPILIRWARAEAGLTQAALAERLGVSQSRIARLEIPGANPSLESLNAVAEALGLRMEIAFVATQR
jgi:DNA-binding XRE family transcriptional regulator